MTLLSRTDVRVRVRWSVVVPIEETIVRVRVVTTTVIETEHYPAASLVFRTLLYIALFFSSGYKGDPLTTPLGKVFH